MLDTNIFLLITQQHTQKRLSTDLLFGVKKAL